MPKNVSSNKQPQGVISVRRGVMVLFAVALVAGTALATVTISHLTAGGAAGTTAMDSPAVRVAPAAETALVPQAATQQAGDADLHIELSTDGFAQGEVTRAAGAFAISVDNRDVTGEYVLQLKGAGGTLINEVRVEKGSAGWTVDLPAGTYTLMVANHPDWVCQIITQ
jgi:hypothetical protein